MHLFIGVPTRGMIRADIVTAWNKLHDEQAAPTAIYEVGHLTAVDARNKLRKQFLASEAQALLMCDDDVKPVSGVLEMAGRGLDICAAPVMLMHPNVNVPFFNVYDYDARVDGWYPDKGMFAKLNSGVEERDAVGFGCVVIQRRVIEALPPFWLDIDEWGVAARSEDLPYCRLARERGFKVGVDWCARAHHIPAVDLFELQERNAAAFGEYMRLSQRPPERERRLVLLPELQG